jgi:hypothetical protein
MIEPADLGWMAAVLELKGMIITKKNKSRATPQVVLVVESKHLAVIDRLCKLTGTNVEAKTQNVLPAEWKRRGCTEHCPDAHIHLLDSPPLPLTSRWTLTGAAAGVVLESLKPYLTGWVTGGFAAAYDMIMTDAALTGRGSGTVKASVFRLMSLGWPLPDGWLASLMADEELSA